MKILLLKSGVRKDVALSVNKHWVKSVQIQGYFWSVSSCIRIEYEFNPNTGKYGPDMTPYLDTFHAVKGSVNKSSFKNVFLRF